jgi:hypothetical protein
MQKKKIRPKEATRAEMARKREFLVGLRKAREQAKRGEGLPVEDVHKLLLR